MREVLGLAEALKLRDLGESRTFWILEHARERTLAELLAMAWSQGIADAGELQQKRN